MPSQAILIHLSTVGIITTASNFYHSRPQENSILTPQTMIVPDSVGSFVRAVGKELWETRQRTNSRLCVCVTWGRASYSLGLRLLI